MTVCMGQKWCITVIPGELWGRTGVQIYHAFEITGRSMAICKNGRLTSPRGIFLKLDFDLLKGGSKWGPPYYGWQVENF